jgi:ATP-dependent Clp protease ATP-binding subunit ClpA
LCHCLSIIARCAFSDEALEAAVKLADKYIADRFLPDKAIDLIDEAGSRARITAFLARRDSDREENPKVQEYLQVSCISVFNYQSRKLFLF